MQEMSCNYYHTIIMPIADDLLQSAAPLNLGSNHLKMQDFVHSIGDSNYWMLALQQWRSGCFGLHAFM